MTDASAEQFTWTAEREDEAMALYRAGRSPGEISKIFGVTRNTVIGKLIRLRTRLGEHIPKTRVKPKEPRIKPIKVRPTDETQDTIEPIAPVIEVRSGSPCSIVDLCGCKWPIDEDDGIVGRHLFCNAPRDLEKPYCDFHTAKASNSSRPANPWRMDEDNQVRAFWNNGDGKQWLASRLQRQANHVTLRARQLGLIRE